MDSDWCPGQHRVLVADLDQDVWLLPTQLMGWSTHEFVGEWLVIKTKVPRLSRVSINNAYVDGVSLTHAQSPRQHIWTFANAVDEARSDHWVCPCTRPDLTYTGAVPSFIGQDYFCETGSRQTFSYIFYPDDSLWDSQGCGGTSTCCEFKKPPIASNDWTPIKICQ